MYFSIKYYQLSPYGYKIYADCSDRMIWHADCIRFLSWTGIEANRIEQDQKGLNNIF